MLENIETMVAELFEMKTYRQKKFKSLDYVVKVYAGKAEKEKSIVHNSYCDFSSWVEKDNRRGQLEMTLGKRSLDELERLHQTWFEEYKGVYTFYYKDGFFSSLFGASNNDDLAHDKVKSRFNDLTVTNRLCDDKVEKVVRKLRTANLQAQAS